MKAKILLILIFALSGTAVADNSAWRWSGVERIVAFADVHGAYDELIGLLQKVDVIDDELNWIGGQTHVVSMGDLLDRGPHSRKVLDFLSSLQKEAADAGGYVHVLMGNHELMNLTGDLRYVSTEEYAAFANEEPAGVREGAFEQFISDKQPATLEEARAEFDRIYPPGYFGLRAAFAPDETYGRWLLDRPLMVVINRTAFAHGGLPPLVATLGLAETNRLLRAELEDYVDTWHALMDMDVLPDYSDAIEDLDVVENTLSAIETESSEPSNSAELAETFGRLSKSDIFDDDGPLWYRGTALCHPLLETPVTVKALSKLDADRVVVGHTPTHDHRVTMRMNDRVVLLDTGMLRSIYKGVPSALIIKDDQVSVVYGAEGPQTSQSQDDATLERFLREAPIEQQDPDANTVVLRQNGNTLESVFRSRKSDPDYRNEIAAYRIDRLLGFNMVPITVERNIEGRPGVLSLRVKNYINENERVEGGGSLVSWCASGSEFDLMYAFDALVGNEGRTRDNMLYFGPDRSLHLTGFSSAFGTRSSLPAYLDNADVILPPELAKRLEALNADNLRDELAGLIDKRQIKALLKRRDEMLKTWPRHGTDRLSP